MMLSKYFTSELHPNQRGLLTTGASGVFLGGSPRHSLCPQVHLQSLPSLSLSALIYLSAYRFCPAMCSSEEQGPTSRAQLLEAERGAESPSASVQGDITLSSSLTDQAQQEEHLAGSAYAFEMAKTLLPFLISRPPSRWVPSSVLGTLLQ